MKTITVNQEQLTNILKNTDKGITLLGPVGVGKTYVFKNHFTTNIPKMYSANDISAIYAQSGMEGIKKEFTYQLQGRVDLIIDDIGTEIIMGYYGSKLDVIEWLILQCYSVGTNMYFTSNLNLDELTERYGARVVDRIKESTYIVALQGKSFRKDTYEANYNKLKSML